MFRYTRHNIYLCTVSVNGYRKFVRMAVAYYTVWAPCPNLYSSTCVINRCSSSLPLMSIPSWIMFASQLSGNALMAFRSLCMQRSTLDRGYRRATDFTDFLQPYALTTLFGASPAEIRSAISCWVSSGSEATLSAVDNG